MPATADFKWTAELPSDGIGGLAASQKIVIAGSRDISDAFDVWIALDILTGEERWRLVYPAPGRLDYGNSPRATPLIWGDIAFLFGAFGHLNAVSVHDGEILWSRDLASEYRTPRMEWGLVGSPVVVDDKVFVQVGGQDGCVVAIEAKSGQTVWTTPGGKAGHSSFVVMSPFGRTQLIGYDDSSAGGWDVVNGKRLWKLAPKLSGDFNVATPIPFGDRAVIFSSENNGSRIHAFESDGMLKLKAASHSSLISPDAHTPVVSKGRLYGVSSGLKCLDANDHLREIWYLDDDEFLGYGSLVVSDRRILIYSERGELVLIDDQGASGQIISRLKVTTDEVRTLAHPAFVGCSMFVRFGQKIARLDLDSDVE